MVCRVKKEREMVVEMEVVCRSACVKAHGLRASSAMLSLIIVE